MATDDDKPKRTYDENLALINQRIKNAPVVLPDDLIAVKKTHSVQMTLWRDDVRGVPNAILRSALFGAIKRGRRAYQTRVKKAAIGGLLVIHTGPQLDQADLDVWMQFVHLAQTSGFKSRIQYSVKGLLKAINRQTGKSQREWLQDAIARLSSSVVEIRDQTKSYSGPLLIHVFKNDLDTEHEQHHVELNPALAKFFDADSWTGIEIDQRNALKKQPLAQWLHAFYSSHSKPFAFKVETIYRLCGSEAQQLKHFKAELKDALVSLSEATKWTCTIDDDDLLHVVKKEKVSKLTKEQQKFNQLPGGFSGYPKTGGGHSTDRGGIAPTGGGHSTDQGGA